MNAQPQQIAVIRTRLPYIDRRALSEAWYSALHLASRQRGALGARRSSALASDAPSAPPRQGGKPASRTTSVPAPHRVTERLRTSASIGAGDDARARSALPARRSYVAQRVASPPAYVTFTTTVAHARVHIAARQEGNRLHLVAVCSAQHIVTVQRALALATIALGMHGTHLSATARAQVQR